MKKLLILPAIIGLIAVPSLAMAQQGADDTSPDVRHQSNSLTKPTIVATQNSSDDSTAPGTNQTSTTRSNDDSNTPVTVPEGSITVDEAKTVALGVFPDKTIAKVETEMEHGVLVYEVKFTDGSEVKVLASDGTVVESEAEDNEHGDDNSGQSGHNDNDDNSGSGSNHSGRSGHDN